MEVEQQGQVKDTAGKNRVLAMQWQTATVFAGTEAERQPIR